jgi:hypothetical protein
MTNNKTDIDPDYLEVLVDIAMMCGAMFQRNEITIVDSRTVPDTVKRLADEFTAMHANTDWNETDYLDTIDEYAEPALIMAYPKIES